MTELAFIDANVFYSRTLRDWLFMLRIETKANVFTLASSWDVISEAASRLRDKHPAARGQLVGQLIEKCTMFIDDLVTDYPGGAVDWIPDEGDWHVHHTAIACSARYLVAEDRGFTDTGSFYKVLTCDEFFLLINQKDPGAVQRVTAQQAKFWAT